MNPKTRSASIPVDPPPPEQPGAPAPPPRPEIPSAPPQEVPAKPQRDVPSPDRERAENEGMIDRSSQPNLPPARSA